MVRPRGEPMQYDVQRSALSAKERESEPPAKRGAAVSKAQKGATKSARAAAAKSKAPPLRDRLREVIERDRALADSQPAPERERFGLGGDLLDGHDDRDAPAKSGTHARLPGYSRSQFVGHGDPKAATTNEEPESFSVFASWIEEELIELDESDFMPVMLTPEPPPSPHRLSLPPSPASTSHALADELQPSLEPVVAQPELVLDFETALLTELADETDALLASTAEDRQDVQDVHDLHDDTIMELPPLPSVELRRPVKVEAATTVSGYSSSTAITSEPIRTRTMARLLAGHGYRVRALAIYDFLLADDPDDLELLIEAEALRNNK